MSTNQIENPSFYPNQSVQFIFGDLFQVKSKLDSYELQNISRIVNVLGGQYTEVLQEHEEITEEDNYSEFENETNQENSTTTSTSEAMESVASNQQDKENAFSVSGQVKANYGTIKAQVDSSFDNKNGSSSSNSNSKSYAKSVVESSRKSVRTRILTQQRKNTQIRDLETKKIGLDNRGGSNYVGIYRHISEVHEAKLLKHQKHLFAKIFLPTPSENYSKHISGVLTVSQDSPVGLKFTKGNDKVDLTFANLVQDNWIDDNWIDLAAEFGIENPTLYPNIKYENKSAIKELNDVDKGAETLSTKTLTFNIPEGYLPNKIVLTPTWGVNSGSDEKGTYMDITVAKENMIRLGISDHNVKYIDLNYFDNTNFTDNKLLVGYQTGWTYSFHINTLLEYKPNSITLELWRLNFYNQILAASEGKLTAEDKLGLSRRVNVLANADAAKALIKEELERQTIQYVLGTNLNGFDSYDRTSDDPNDTVSDNNYPDINMPKANSLQNIVSFLSTSFDFEKMSYRFLPAYLGSEDNRSKIFDSKNSGEIRNFLQAGWAEVIIPITRGEEYKLFYMLETGLVWSSSDEEAPLPNKRDYLALSEEIEEDRILTAGKEPYEDVVDTWNFNLPTPFEILQEGGELNGTPTASSNSTLTSGSSDLGG